MKVYVVWDGWYDAGEVDSAWLDREKAEARASELRASRDYDYRDEDDPSWEVLDVRIRDADESEDERAMDAWIDAHEWTIQWMRHHSPLEPPRETVLKGYRQWRKSNC